MQVIKLDEQELKLGSESGWKKGNPINPNEYPYLKKITAYSQLFLQQYFQNRVGNP
jgi:hypothetical protein